MYNQDYNNYQPQQEIVVVDQPMQQQEVIIVTEQGPQDPIYQANPYQQPQPYQSYQQAEQIVQAQQVANPYPANGCRQSVNIICPYCMKKGFTRIELRKGTNFWIAFCILFFLCFPCILFPLCMPSYSDCYSLCPHCGQIVGIAT